VPLLILARHGQSLFNVDGLVNGDPARDRGLSDLGVRQAEELGRQLAGIEIDACVVSEFRRARETAERALAVAGRTPPVEVDAGLNDVRIGDLEGKTLADYRRWKAGRGREEPFPGGESLDDAARRYAEAFERLASRPAGTVLVVCHEIPVRYAVNAAAGSDELDGPAHDIVNATPYLFDPESLARAAARIRELAGSSPHAPAGAGG
jgi:broad specificity phosphatase PhoE